MHKKFCLYVWVFVAIVGKTHCDYIPNEVLVEYILPEEHWVKEALDTIFSHQDVLLNDQTLVQAGFIILHRQKSGMRVAAHPKLPGYLIKTYLGEAVESMGTRWLWDRCRGADNIRKLIHQENLQHFLVPEKKIYFVTPTKAILVVQDMQVVSKAESKMAWQAANKMVLRELYIILSHGYASCYLHGNIPYTRYKKFACVDTQYPERSHQYGRVKRHFSSKGKKYWDQLVQSG